MYQQRINTLKGNTAATQEKVAKVDADLADLNAKVVDMLNKVNLTANEYYETVSLANSYQVDVPSSASGLSTTKSVVKSSIQPMMILEALVFVLYFGGTFLLSLILTNRKKRAEETQAEETAAASAEAEAPAEAETPAEADAEKA